jgi:hypothetical protein
MHQQLNSLWMTAFELRIVAQFRQDFEGGDGGAAQDKPTMKKRRCEARVDFADLLIKAMKDVMDSA